MAKVFADISISLDGFVAGPDPSFEEPLGKGGEGLHEWAFPLAAFREPHGREGGETGPDDDVLREVFDRQGAAIMGRRMFGGGPGPWDGSWRGWWGEEPPFHEPVFVLTHHPREPLQMQGGTTFNFVTDGIEAALEEARAAAGEKDVAVSGGAETIQQYLRAGLLDELQVHVAPILLGGGTRLFDGVAGIGGRLEQMRSIGSPAVTHLRYRIAR